ncbi:hypothetical protein BV898_11688 [Hypsibius exemplaris]|uniref:Uncharacterized protein n=1 Tax=Hypsibius exemplaris TaxID=2072580 RepID=A0A1W0WG61_HYPEX|nr:hypothetical protein BV898_11688 [Hypsibius exemplaris]
MWLKSDWSWILHVMPTRLEQPLTTQRSTAPLIFGRDRMNLSRELPVPSKDWKLDPVQSMQTAGDAPDASPVLDMTGLFC